MDLVEIVKTRPIDEYEVIPSECMPSSPSSPFHLAENNTKLAINASHVVEFYRSLSKEFFATKSQLSSSVMDITRAMVILNPDALTAWNYRKRFISMMEITGAASEELSFTAMVLKRRPKSACVWFHRKWICERFNMDLVKELAWHTAEILPLHDRAYHSWVYCSELLSKMPSSFKEEECFVLENYLRKNPKNASAMFYYATFSSNHERKKEFCLWLTETYPQFSTGRIGLKLLPCTKI